MGDLRGMFAFFLYDKRDDSFMVVRDHIGIIPLYMGWAEDGSIWVSSEMKVCGLIPAMRAVARSSVPPQEGSSRYNAAFLEPIALVPPFHFVSPSRFVIQRRPSRQNAASSRPSRRGTCTPPSRASSGCGTTPSGALCRRLVHVLYLQLCLECS